MTSSHRVAGGEDSQAAGMVMAGEAGAGAGLAGDDTITDNKIGM